MLTRVSRTLVNVTNPAATREWDPGKTLKETVNKLAATLTKTAGRAVETNPAGTVTVADTVINTLISSLQFSLSPTMFATSTPT